MTDVYDQNLQKLVQSGYAERAPENELNRNDASVWYTTHNPMLKPGDVRSIFIVRRDTREWVLMVNGLNRAYKLAQI